MRLGLFDDYRLCTWRDDTTLVDITSLVSRDVAPPDRMSALIRRWPQMRDLVAVMIAVDPSIAVDKVTLRAPLPHPSKVLAAPVNYELHRHEMGVDPGVYATGPVKTIETYAGFCKASSSVVGPDRAIELPYPDRRVDYEAEVGVVIGRAARRVPAAEAMSYVFGYMPVIDVTMRGEEDRSFRKSFDTFTPVGPAIVTADAVPDPDDIAFELTVNGDVRQRGNTRDLIYDIPRLIELYSDAMTLLPGDLIATGTPDGIGKIEAGDELALTMQGAGTLVMRAKARSMAAS